MIIQLNSYIPVIVSTKTGLPAGMSRSSGKGMCIAWESDNEELYWLVVLNDTGECVMVPMKDIRVAPNWTMLRRYVDELPEKGVL